MPLRHGQAVLLMVLTTAMWSIAGVVSRQLQQAQSFEVTFWRSFFTVLSLVVILPLWQGRGVWRRLPWRNAYFWVSGLCWSIMFTAFMLGMALTGVANVLITMALGPLLTALLSRLVLGHKLPARTWSAIAAAGAGIVWMYGREMMAAEGDYIAGMLVALCVPMAAAVQWTAMQKAHSKGIDIDLVPSVLLGAVLSSLYTLLPAQPMQASTSDLMWLATLGLFQLAVPCVLAVMCARALKAPEMALLGLLEVIFGILLAWVGADEVPSASVLQGGTLVIGALVFNEWLGWRQRRV